MKLANSILTSIIFVLLSVFFTGYFVPTLIHFNVGLSNELTLFVSSPFNISSEGHPLYNVIFPAMLILILGVYLENFNTAFKSRCDLRAIFAMAILASYVKSIGSMIYYRGYVDFGISLGTSIITLSFIAVFLISLEVYIERRERLERYYGHFMFSLLSALILLLAVLAGISFFATSSFIVHAMGLIAFLVMFVPFFERQSMAEYVQNKNRTAASRAKQK
jgi:hypothetical protein